MLASGVKLCMLNRGVLFRDVGVDQCKWAATKGSFAWSTFEASAMSICLHCVLLLPRLDLVPCTAPLLQLPKSVQFRGCSRASCYRSWLQCPVTCLQKDGIWFEVGLMIVVNRDRTDHQAASSLIDRQSSAHLRVA